MNNEELERTLSLKISELRDLNDKAIKIAQEVIGETLFKTDLYFCAILNRSIQLTDGFIDLIRNRNLTCSGILLRANMDNCLRLYAMLIAKNPDEVVEHLIQGNRLDKLEDKNGNKLKDCYLKEQLDKYDSKFALVYKNASGYVHFSEKGFFQSVSAADNDYPIDAQVSHEIPEKANKSICECVQAYIHFLKLFYSMFKDIIRLKSDYDKSQEIVNN